MKLSKNCLKCNKQFTARQTDINRGYGKFCSLSCSTSFTKTKEKLPNTICSYCNIVFYKKPSNLRNSRSGFYFCCRTHKDLAQRIGGIKEIQPPHYGVHEPKRNYRILAFRHLPNQCVECGYCKILNVLDVHHIDHNRSNNNIENLEILCPTCHMERHFILKTGRYTDNRR
jgi:HNH endonuclease